MKTQFLVIFAILAILSSNALAAESSMTLKGTLAYRAACRDGVAAPFQNSSALGTSIAQLYLIDRTGAVVAAPTRPSNDGNFRLRVPYRGQFALKIAAGDLTHFWRSGSRTAVPIRIPPNAKVGTFSLGTVCIDADQPKGFVVTQLE